MRRRSEHLLLSFTFGGLALLILPTLLILCPSFNGSKELGPDGWAADGGVGAGEAEEFFFGEVVDGLGHEGFPLL